MKGSNVKTKSFKVCLASILFAVLALATAVAQSLQSGNENLHVVFTDSSSAVLQADFVSGGLSVLAIGQKLVRPFSIASGHNGELYVSDTGTGAIVAIDPNTAAQRIVSSGGILGFPCGITVENDGNILVANASAIVRIDPTTGAQSIAVSDGFLRVPLAVAVRPNGDILAIDATRKIIEIDPRTRTQTLISQNNFLNHPQAIAARGNSIYVTDVATPSYGIGRVIQVDARTGKQTVLSEGGNLVGPVGITAQENGGLIVSDPYTFNQNHELAGAIIAVDAQTGGQTVIVRGQDNFINPRCAIVLPEHEIISSR